MQVLGAGGGLGGPAGPGGNFGGKTPNLGAAPHDWGFAKNDIIQNYPNTAQSPPTSRLWYLSNYHDALQAHMHPLHKLGNAIPFKAPKMLPDPYHTRFLEVARGN